MMREDMYEKICAHRQIGYSMRQAADELGIDRKTIAKYWNMTPKEYVAYLAKSATRTKGLDKYRAEITVMLDMYPNITAAIVFDRLREQHDDFKPSYRSVRLYVAKIREELGIPKQSTIRQYQEVAELPPGFQAQVDMGQKQMNNAYGKRVKVYIFAMVLSHCRKKFVCFQDKPFSAKDFIMAHDLAFKYYGGRTEEIVYDQDRVMAVSENAGDIVFTEAFDAYKRYAGFNIRLCKGNDPESKGKIENVVKYVKGNYLACRIYHGIAELNTGGIAWLDRCANAKIHETTKLIPDKVFASERKYLKTVPSIESPPEAKSAIVRKTNVVHFKQNRYEVPKGTYFPGRVVYIEANYQSKTVLFSDEKSGEVLAQHRLCEGIGRLIKLNGDNKAARAQSYQKLQRELLEEMSGIKGSKNYIDALIDAYPRYAKDQLSLMLRCVRNYSAKDVAAALEYCVGRELISANDFRDTLEYLVKQNPRPKAEKTTIPTKYQMIQPKVRNIADYQNALGGDAA